MKFRAVMQSPQCMREFQNIVMMLSKLTKEIVIRISAQKLRFIANEESGTVAPLVWVEIDAKAYFTEYTMDGASETQPEIILTVSAVNMARAFGAFRQNVTQCKIKLTNIQFPCLSIEAAISCIGDTQRHIVHHVPANVIQRSDWLAYPIPQSPTAKVVLNVPKNRFMRSFIDRIKNLSPTINFNATSNGELNLVAVTEQVTMTTRYKNLELRALNPKGADKTKERIESSCPVDGKKTAIFFGALQLSTLELSIGVDDECTVHLEVNVREGVAVHTILPAVCM